jgi:ribonuclease HI
LGESRISKKGGSLGFIDDFTAWRTGSDRVETTEKLQNEVLQVAERWSAESGATFEASKTGFIHFERSSVDEQARPSLRFLGSEIRPQDKIKILGVVLDEKLKMTAHIDKIVASATQKCLALGRLRGIRPRQMRQLHRAVVDTTIDYAASTWYARGRLGVTGHISRLERIQRMGAQSIIGAFRTVSSGVLQDEAGLEAVETRLARKVAKHALEVRALPQQHPLWAVMNGMGARNDRCKSPLFATWSRYQEVIEGKKGVGVYPASPYTLPPWHELRNFAFVHDEVEARRTHRQLLQSFRQQQMYYTDASVRNGWAGISVIKHHRDTGSASYIVIHQETIGRERTCKATSAEVYAIKTAVEYARKEKRTAWVMSDSQEAIRRISDGGRSKASREIVTATLRELQLAKERGIEVKLLWIPGHKGIAGNERAHCAAQDTTRAHRTPDPNPRQRVRERLETFRLLQTAVRADIPAKPSRWGRYTYSLDCAAPGKHTLQLYGALSREDAGILAQARTGHTHLRDYLARTRQIASATCECKEGVETVKHVILQCPTWSAQRQQLREVAGGRWGDVSFLLGGKSRKIDTRTGKPVDGERWRPNLVVVRATIAFLKGTGRFAAHAQVEQHL